MRNCRRFQPRRVPNTRRQYLHGGRFRVLDKRTERYSIPAGTALGAPRQGYVYLCYVYGDRTSVETQGLGPNLPILQRRHPLSFTGGSRRLAVK